MRFNIFLIIKVGYILVTEIKKAAKDDKITRAEAYKIMKKLLDAAGYEFVKGAIDTHGK